MAYAENLRRCVIKLRSAINIGFGREREMDRKKRHVDRTRNLGLEIGSPSISRALYLHGVGRERILILLVTVIHRVRFCVTISQPTGKQHVINPV